MRIIVQSIQLKVYSQDKHLDNHNITKCSFDTDGVITDKNSDYCCF